MFQINDGNVIVIYENQTYNCKLENLQVELDELILNYKEDSLTQDYINKAFNISVKNDDVTKNQLFEDSTIVEINSKLHERIMSSNLFSTIEHPEGMSYTRKTNFNLPLLLMSKMIEAHENNDAEYLNALDAFWVRCCLCFNWETRRDLFKFLFNHDMTILSNGCFIAYRNVKIKEEGSLNKKDLNFKNFIDNQYLKVKGWKKSPKKFNVYKKIEDGKESFITSDKNKTSNDNIQYKLIGNLAEIYEKSFDNIETERIYTDNYTKTMTIKLGEPVNQKLSECDFNNENACSRGLHLGNKNFVSRNSFGNVGLLCVIDPASVVAVPKYDSNKLRCFEYLPICEISFDEDGKVVSPLSDVQVIDFLNDYDYDLKRNRDLINEHRLTNNINFDKETDSNFLVNIIKNNHNEISRNVEIWTRILNERFIEYGKQS